MKLLTVEAARARMLAGVAAPAAEAVALDAALGRVLAVDLIAARDQPPFAASAMDGWAVRSMDAPGRLAIIGESAAGHGFAGVVGPGQAVRIFTGGAVPAGADAVVMQEDATRDGGTLVVPLVREPRHVRPAGQDFRTGQTLLDAGARLDPWRLALVAAAGLAKVSVAPRPRVAILATGEEIVPPGTEPGPFQIFNSGSTALGALASAWGAEARPLAAVGDDLDATRQAVATAPCDLVVTIGGASVGDHDVVKPALAGLGLELLVESVAMRPGKPTWFGRLADGRRVLGLAGNPASAMVGAELFLRPLLMALQGADPGPRLVAARLAERLPASGPREHWARARLAHAADGALVVHVQSEQDSSLVGVFARADALVRRAPGAPEALAGDLVDILPLERLS